MSTLTSELLLERAYMDGRWVEADSGETFAVRQPGDGRDASPQVPRMGAAETRRAIEAAQRALPGVARACWPRSAPRSCAAGPT